MSKHTTLESKSKPSRERSKQKQNRKEKHHHSNWLRRRDLNPRPLGYEPNELPLLYPAILTYLNIFVKNTSSIVLFLFDRSSLHNVL